MASVNDLILESNVRERLYPAMPFKILQIYMKTARACLKNHSRNLHAPLCGRFHPNSVVVARAAHPNSSEMHCKMMDILGGHKVPGNSPMPCVRQSVYYAL